MKTILVIDPTAQKVVDTIIFADDAVVAAGGAAVMLGEDEFAVPAGRLFFDGPGGIGWNWDGQGPAAPPEPEVDLIVLKASLKAAIDGAAEREREKYITTGAGQTLTYQRKADEAQRLDDRLAADPNYEPDPVDYPLLAAEVGITAPTLVGVGQVVLAALQRWLAIGGAIEAVRLGAKGAIDMAGDVAAALAVKPVWPAP